MKRESWWNSGWGISIGTAVFSLLLTIVYDYAKSNPILSTISSILVRIWEWLILVLNFNIKLWWLLAAILIIVLVILYLIAASKETDLPSFLEYKEEKFANWKWSWSWSLNARSGKWNISELVAHCPKCDTHLVQDSSFYRLYFNCPRCGFTPNEYSTDDPKNVEAVKVDNIRRKFRD